MARLETQVSTLSSAREVMVQELSKTQELYANLKREQETFSGKSFELRKTLIE